MHGYMAEVSAASHGGSRDNLTPSRTQVVKARVQRVPPVFGVGVRTCAGIDVARSGHGMPCRVQRICTQQVSKSDVNLQDGTHLTLRSQCARRRTCAKIS